MIVPLCSRALDCRCSLAPCSLAADWPQWRGPNRDGISQGDGPFQGVARGRAEAPLASEDLGDGYSTPAVVGDRIYRLGSKGMDDESVYCLDAADGKTLWTSRMGNVGAQSAWPTIPALDRLPRSMAIGSMR